MEAYAVEVVSDGELTVTLSWNCSIIASLESAYVKFPNDTNWNKKKETDVLECNMQTHKINEWQLQRKYKRTEDVSPGLGVPCAGCGWTEI